jgi:WD40 repeat protein
MALAVLWLMSSAFAQTNLRQEQIDRQKSGGYRLADFTRGSVHVADFSRQDKWLSESSLPAPLDKALYGLLSPSGKWIAVPLRGVRNGTYGGWLAIVGRDGNGLRGFPELDYGFCWSPDGRRLVAGAGSQDSSSAQKIILDLESGQTEELALPPDAFMTTQCWSPDGQKLLYYVMDRKPGDFAKKATPNQGTLFTYDIAQKQSFRITRGQYPTWSPNGEWIAYLDHDVYYRIAPTGEGAQRLFRHKDVQSPLIWSPDSRLVLYFRCCTLWQSLQCMCDVGRWYVLRLEDHAQVQVGSGSPGFNTEVWIGKPQSF